MITTERLYEIATLIGEKLNTQRVTQTYPNNFVIVTTTSMFNALRYHFVNLESVFGRTSYWILDDYENDEFIEIANLCDRVDDGEFYIENGELYRRWHLPQEVTPIGDANMVRYEEIGQYIGRVRQVNDAVLTHFTQGIDPLRDRVADRVLREAENARARGRDIRYSHIDEIGFNATSGEATFATNYANANMEHYTTTTLRDTINAIMRSTIVNGEFPKDKEDDNTELTPEDTRELDAFLNSLKRVATKEA